MRVILTGSQGTGKSTILHMMRGRKHITEVVRRLVKEEGLVINEDGGMETQQRIWAEYEKQLDQDNYVSDRGLTDVISYSRANYAFMNVDDPKRTLLHDEMMREYEAIKTWHEAHKDIKYVYFPIEFDVVDDGVRSTNEAYRKQVDYFIKNILDDLGIDYLTVHGTPEERLKQIQEWVKK